MLKRTLIGVGALLVALILVAGLRIGVVRAAVEGAPPAALHPELAGVFGDDGAAQWDSGTAKYSVGVDPALGLPALSTPDTTGVTLEGKVRYTGDREFRAWVRLRKGAGPFVISVARSQAQQADPKNPGSTKAVETNVGFRLTGAPAAPGSGGGSGGAGYVNAYAFRNGQYNPLNTKPSRQDVGFTRPVFNDFTYYLRSYEQFLPGWAEDMRAHIEHDMGELPVLGDKWFGVRIEVRHGLARFWVDDRMVAWQHDDAIQPDGTVTIELGPGMQLAGFRTSPPIAEAGFLPVRLSGYANGRAFMGGAPLATDSLPGLDKIVHVGGVPFVFTGVNPEGHDHLDISRSLFRQADYTGYWPVLGPIWDGAQRRDPARIQLRVPNAAYDALYVLAAADGQADHVPVLTAMFYRPTAGFSENFATTVPLATAKAQTVYVSSQTGATPNYSTAVPGPSLPVKLTDGRTVNLWLVKIPLNPGQLSSLSDLDVVEIELTKGVEQYRSYPDPILYGWHQAGPPSSVHVYGVTLARSPIDFDWQPDAFGGVWQTTTPGKAPAKVSYTATVTNHTPLIQTGTLVVTTRSYDGKETTEFEKPFFLDQVHTPWPQPVKLEVPLQVKRFGYHDVTATLQIAGRTWVEKRSLVLLAPDTRSARWSSGRGAEFGFWSYMGGHYTPDADEHVRLMTWAGARTCISVPANLKPQAKALVEKHWGGVAAGPWEVTPHPELIPDHVDPKVAQKVQDDSLAALIKWRKDAPQTHLPDHVFFFPEPGISPRLSSGDIPEYWQEKPYQYTPDEQNNLNMYLHTSEVVAKGVREKLPGLKILNGWSDPLFDWPLLRAGLSKDLIDGTGLDIPGFERMPERQLHEQSIHRLYMVKKEFEKIGIANPDMRSCEGIFVPTEVGAVSWREQMDIYNRWSLVEMAYGVQHFYSGWFAFDCGSYYGAEHYGGCGIQRRIPYCDPKPAYAAYAAMTDQLNEANFDGWLKTGSLSTYCLRFKKADNKGFVYALWTLRGKRPVTLTLDHGSSFLSAANVRVTDAMDNTTEVKINKKQVTVMTDPSVVYVSFPKGKGEVLGVQVGEPDHSDDQPPITSMTGPSPGVPHAPVSFDRTRAATEVADLGDGSWQFSNQRDMVLENNHYAMMHYLGKFSAQIINAPTKAPYDVAAGSSPGNTTAAPLSAGHALETTLEKQDAVHELMPWYNVLKPAKPIVLKGAPTRLGLWVCGNSDWGRVIYVLRDAKGQRWTSIGSKDEYNCDDSHSWSQFCFDGWRYLTFELPANYGYDNYRRYTSNWWRADEGKAGADTNIVNLPLSLDAIIIEQRTNILYVNDVQRVAGNTVAFGKLYAEYDNPAEATDEFVKSTKLRMSMPTGLPELPNPIAEMAASGTLPAPAILKLRPPDREADGTRVFVDFEPMPGAEKHYLWVSAHADGRGAVNVTPGGLLKDQLVYGLRPAVKFYFWITYTDKGGKTSKPSAAHEETLVNMFKEQ